MKKILKFSLVLAAVVLTAAQAHAGNADFSLDLIKEEGKTVSFNLKETKKINLSIYDTNDSLIYQEKVTSEDNISRTYDLTALPDGIYFLKAESDLKISKYKIEVVGNKAKLSADAISEVYKPVLENKNGMVTVNILNLGKAPVTVAIYNSEENEVYNETLTVDLYVGKIFDLTSAPSSKYTFEITYNGNTYIETVTTK
ncbi:Por secretion system C-terminal sorting domain-containing protein [Flavobacterium omnivorum]|uniref:Por secretion system C-terminal sorting domain-containing protein n=1 Tax=Flavobacterium omnivorum TaxID=178355 RepID=A0A1G7YPX8_9FLAO|nr:T9SS type A sorting domain-containing protein [Flavobacterium omnivorum]SDG98497.1 Por secretion system C-terminal sorting domain-containing protein [Flavobacterium omnivorum]